MDAHQVTRAMYLAFIEEHPEWQKPNVPALFADSQYLKSWRAPLSPNPPLSAPVTEISWFAARAYCESKGQSLPTIEEWELFAMADESKTDASEDGRFLERILNWYSKPSVYELGTIKSGYKNIYGIWDLHGLVWEWTEDFNSVIVDPQACGAAGVKDNFNKKDYAKFMRFAFRSSLKAASTIKRLGFRCVTRKAP